MSDLGRAGAATSPKRSRKLRAIDCDVHEELTSINVLLPYMDDGWKRYLTNRGFGGMPRPPYALWTGVDRSDTWEADGTSGSAHFERVKWQLLDEWDLEYAILTGAVSGLRFCALPQYEFAGALASAYNDFLIQNWLGKDPRIKASIHIAAQDPIPSAREIDRVADHPDFVQIVLPTQSPGVQWSDEKYYPIWEAAERHNLPVAFHVCPSAGTMPPPSPSGWPRTYIEMKCGYHLNAQAELIGLVLRGTFEKFPRLRIAMVENGFSWLPSLMWRLDKNWREVRAEVPWLKRKPSEYILEHVRFTTQPMDEPEDSTHLIQTIEMMGSDKLLMFATDYPHYDFDSPHRALPNKLPRDLVQKILVDNAREFYGLPVRDVSGAEGD